MGLIESILLFLANILSSVVANEIKEWTPSMVNFLLTHAVAQLPSDRRERFKEEWASHINDVPGDVGKLIVALGFLPAALHMSWILNKRRIRSTKRRLKVKSAILAHPFVNSSPVATPTHRMVASAIDAIIILIGFGLLVTMSEFLGGSFGGGRAFWIGMVVALGLVSMLYGLIWAIAGRETVGMQFTDLQLITFDGFHVDSRSRALRFASTWLSYCSGGLGILWAVADGENLHAPTLHKNSYGDQH